MNAPLVIAQGDLLSPTLFPLAGMPHAIYGEEWTLSGVRPALSEYEIPFYAARFLTDYVSAPSLRNDRFPDRLPYTPASLWGKFKRNDEIDHALQSVPPIPANATPQAAEPAPFAFEPFTAPDDHHVNAPAAHHDHRKQLAGGAIALACAALIAWALFGTKIGHQDAQTHNPKLVLSATPVVKPMPESETVHASGASNATVAVASASAASAASAATSAAATIAAVPAVQKPVVVSEASASSKPLASTSTIASHGQSTTPNTVSDRATRPRTIAQTVGHSGSKAKAKSKRDAHRYELVHRRHGHEYQGAPVYRSAGHETRLALPARRTLTREHTRANAVNASLSVTDMHSLLAHSAVLDDNSSASRQPVRSAPAAPREPASIPSPRSGARDTPNWNSGLSQRRVTDTPVQFSK